MEYGIAQRNCASKKSLPIGPSSIYMKTVCCIDTSSEAADRTQLHHLSPDFYQWEMSGPVAACAMLQAATNHTSSLKKGRVSLDDMPGRCCVTLIEFSIITNIRLLMKKISSNSFWISWRAFTRIYPKKVCTELTAEGVPVMLRLYVIFVGTATPYTVQS